MKEKRRYTLSLEDQAYQRTRFSCRFRPIYMYLLLFLGAAALMTAGALLTLLTPLSRLMPDYLTDSQRLASQQAIMRVDSLNGVSGPEPRMAAQFPETYRYRASARRLNPICPRSR